MKMIEHITRRDLKKIRKDIEDRVCPDTGLESDDILEPLQIAYSERYDPSRATLKLLAQQFDADSFVKKYGTRFGTTAEDIVLGVSEHVKTHEYCKETVAMFDKEEQMNEAYKKRFCCQDFELPDSCKDFRKRAKNE